MQRLCLTARMRFGKAGPVIAWSTRSDATHAHISASGCRQHWLPAFDALKRTTAIALALQHSTLTGGSKRK
eukprot:1542545-Prymnesium_polylepis.1